MCRSDKGGNETPTAGRNSSGIPCAHSTGAGGRQTLRPNAHAPDRRRTLLRPEKDARTPAANMKLQVTSFKYVGRTLIMWCGSQYATCSSRARQLDKHGVKFSEQNNVRMHPRTLLWMGRTFFLDVLLRDGVKARHHFALGGSEAWTVTLVGPMGATQGPGSGAAWSSNACATVRSSGGVNHFSLFTSCMPVLLWARPAGWLCQGRAPLFIVEDALCRQYQKPLRHPPRRISCSSCPRMSVSASRTAGESINCVTIPPGGGVCSCS